MQRLVVLGTGTGVGKTYVTTRLVETLAGTLSEHDIVGIKAIETGFRRRRARSGPPPGSDAFALEAVSRGAPIRPHPLASFRDAVSPHLAARRERTPLSIPRLARQLALHGATLHGWQIVETAGGVFSPLGPRTTNLDLARALEPAVWLLIAPDALGVLHDVRATVLAMAASARAPDYLVLTASRGVDPSAGTNAAELARVGLPRPVASIGPNDDAHAALAPLVRALVRHLRGTDRLARVREP